MSLSFNHPLHPAFVHFPIAFVPLAAGFDVLFAALRISPIPYVVQRLGPRVHQVSEASFFLQTLALVTAVPAVLTGILQLLVMLQRGGIYEQDKKTIRPKVLTTLIHAATMDTSIGLIAWSWFARRDVVDYVPQVAHVAATVAATLLVFYSAALGGQLTYEHGVGLNVGGAAKKSKTK